MLCLFWHLCYLRHVEHQRINRKHATCEEAQIEAARPMALKLPHSSSSSSTARLMEWLIKRTAYALCLQDWRIEQLRQSELPSTLPARLWQLKLFLFWPARWALPLHMKIGLQLKWGILGKYTENIHSNRELENSWKTQTNSKINWKPNRTANKSILIQRSQYNKYKINTRKNTENILKEILRNNKRLIYFLFYFCRRESIT